MTLNTSSKFCFSKKLTYVLLFIFLIGISLVSFSSLSSSVNKTTSSRAETNDSPVNSPCGEYGQECCQEKEVKKAQDDYAGFTLSNEGRFTCTDPNTKCWMNKLYTIADDVGHCLKLEDVCGMEKFSPCCANGGCRGRTDLECVQKDESYDNPWSPRKLSNDPDALIDNKEISPGICVGKPTKESNKECGTYGKPCCQNTQCDDIHNSCVITRNEKDTYGEECRKNAEVELKLYKYPLSDITNEKTEITDNMNLIVGGFESNNLVNPNILYLKIETNLALTNQYEGVIDSPDREYLFACNYKKEDDLKRITNFFANERTFFCNYTTQEMNKPIVIAIGVTKNDRIVKTVMKKVTLRPYTGILLKATPTPVDPNCPTTNSTCGNKVGDSCCELSAQRGYCCHSGLSCTQNGGQKSCVIDPYLSPTKPTPSPTPRSSNNTPTCGIISAGQDCGLKNQACCPSESNCCFNGLSCGTNKVCN